MIFNVVVNLGLIRAHMLIAVGVACALRIALDLAHAAIAPGTRIPSATFPTNDCWNSTASDSELTTNGTREAFDNHELSAKCA